MYILASNGLLYAFTESTVEGKIILAVLFVASIFSWTVMVSKMRFLSYCKKQSRRFLTIFHRDRAPLRIYESEVDFDGSPFYDIYMAGCRELCFQMLGSTEVDETFRARLDTAPRISAAQMQAVTVAMERAVGESSLRFESQMYVLSTVVAGAPFIGLLGTVWGIMDAFGGIARAGNANFTAMAPGIAGSLITTVVALIVAIPAMFGYNYLVVSIRSFVLQTENFAAELASEIEHRYVELGAAARHRSL